jgi:hypothetical protein
MKLMNRIPISSTEATNGWKAVFAVDGKPLEIELAQWAIVEDTDGCRFLTGIIADGPDLVDAYDMHGFLGYLAPNEFAVDRYGAAAEEYEKRIQFNSNRDRQEKYNQEKAKAERDALALHGVSWSD